MSKWLKTFPHKDDIDYNEHAVPAHTGEGAASGNVDPLAQILDVSEDDGNATEHVVMGPAQPEGAAASSSDSLSSTSSDSDILHRLLLF